MIGVAELEERQQGIKDLFEELITENFPNSVKEIDIKVQEVQSSKQDESKQAYTKTHYN